MSEQFQIGNEVRMKTDHQWMTITEISKDGKTATCFYRDSKGSTRSEGYPVVTLTKEQIQRIFCV